MSVTLHIPRTFSNNHINKIIEYSSKSEVTNFFLHEESRSIKL